MAEIGSSSPYDIKIESVLLTSDRLQLDYEIAANVVEINIFEDIDLPYLTGSILIVDSNELFTAVGFQGTEKIKIRVHMRDDDSSKSVEKTFVVTDIKILPAQDTSEVMLLNIIETHGYLDKLITVSKAYEGKPETIITKILKDNLDLDVVVPKEFTGSAVQPMKIIIPSTSALSAARWMKDRLISTSGMPFFLYSTLNGPNLFLTDLEFLLKESPLNDGRAYAYGQSFNRFTSTLTVLDQARNIESYSLPRAENMLGLAMNGTLNSTYQFIDTTKEQDVRSTEIKVNMEDVLDHMIAQGILPQDQRGTIYDNDFKLNGKTISEYNPSLLTQITSSNTFTGFANYYESASIELQKLKSIGRALRYYLLKSPLEIIMPGFEFLGRDENNTIGRQIILRFLKNNPDIVQSEENLLDEKRSGKYMIYGCRHLIKPEKYSVSLACVKLGNQQL